MQHLILTALKLPLDPSSVGRKKTHQPNNVSPIYILNIRVSRRMRWVGHTAHMGEK
jgi:hypothetical protein